MKDAVPESVWWTLTNGMDLRYRLRSWATLSATAVLDWDVVTVEAIWEQQTHCHVHKTSHQKMVHCDHIGMDMVSNNTPAGSSVLTTLSWYWGAQRVPRKSPHHYSSSLNHRYTAGWIHISLFVYNKFWPYHANVAANIMTHQTR